MANRKIEESQQQSQGVTLGTQGNQDSSSAANSDKSERNTGKGK